ncbi:MAG TPA: hypothetical protein VK771_02740, partial [Acidimicrobiia bacterium]|nr:hypothetical protein [Acidimicrobiia bacterium]
MSVRNREHIFAHDANLVSVSPRVNQPVGTGNGGGYQKGDVVTKRWKQRPPGSTWGDWGDDDELG